jgi:hypothetical protein
MKEFDTETEIIIADLGSKDRTLKFIAAHTLFRMNRIILMTFGEGTTTLKALSSVLPKIKTDYLIGMSGDDVFDNGFGRAIQNYILPSFEENVMINVTLLHTDEKLIPFKQQKPSWVHSRRINRLKLTLGNPGTGPGAVYPVEKLISVLEDKELNDLLIEDYFIYWKLVDSVNFINLPGARVLYRRHSNALGKQYANPRYSRSIGYLVGLSFSNSNTIIEKFLSVFLFIRWIRHIPKNNIRSYIEGMKIGLIN